MSDLMITGEGGSDEYYNIEFGPLLSQGGYHIFVIILTEMRIFSKMRNIWGQNLGEILVGLRGEAASIWQNSSIFCLNLLER